MTSLEKRISEYPDRLAAALKSYTDTPDASTFKLSGRPDLISSEISEVSKNLRNYELSLTYSKKRFCDILDSMNKDRELLQLETRKPHTPAKISSLKLAGHQLAQSIALAEYLLREIYSQLSTVASARKSLKTAETSSFFADFLNFQRELASLSFFRQLSVEEAKKMGRL